MGNLLEKNIFLGKPIIAVIVLVLILQGCAWSSAEDFFPDYQKLSQENKKVRYAAQLYCLNYEKRSGLNKEEGEGKKKVIEKEFLSFRKDCIENYRGDWALAQANKAAKWFNSTVDNCGVYAGLFYFYHITVPFCSLLFDTKNYGSPYIYDQGTRYKYNAQRK